MKSSQSLPDIYQTYPKSGHTFGGHTPMGRMGIYIGWWFTSPHQKSISTLNG